MRIFPIYKLSKGDYIYRKIPNLKDNWGEINLLVQKGHEVYIRGDLVAISKNRHPRSGWMSNEKLIKMREQAYKE